MLVTFKYLGKTNVIQPLIAYPDFNQEKRKEKRILFVESLFSKFKNRFPINNPPHDCKK